MSSSEGSSPSDSDGSSDSDNENASKSTGLIFILHIEYSTSYYYVFNNKILFSDMGLRSPGALTCGRSVKEIDEQLTNLKKENFNLKLRIYFLEERMGSNFCKDKEDALKNNIELMVNF